MPAGYFTAETISMLAMYCHHAHEWRWCTDTMTTMHMSGDPDLSDLNKLQAMRAREFKTLSEAASKLRITPQAKYDSAKRIPSGNGEKAPWEQ